MNTYKLLITKKIINENNLFSHSYVSMMCLFSQLEGIKFFKLDFCIKTMFIQIKLYYTYKVISSLL